MKLQEFPVFEPIAGNEREPHEVHDLNVAYDLIAAFDPHSPHLPLIRLWQSAIQALRDDQPMHAGVADGNLLETYQLVFRLIASSRRPQLLERIQYHGSLVLSDEAIYEHIIKPQIAYDFEQVASKAGLEQDVLLTEIETVKERVIAGQRWDTPDHYTNDYISLLNSLGGTGRPRLVDRLKKYHDSIAWLGDEEELEALPTSVSDPTAIAVAPTATGGLPASLLAGSVDEV